MCTHARTAIDARCPNLASVRSNLAPAVRVRASACVLTAGRLRRLRGLWQRLFGVGDEGGVAHGDHRAERRAHHAQPRVHRDLALLEARRLRARAMSNSSISMLRDSQGSDARARFVKHAHAHKTAPKRMRLLGGGVWGGVLKHLDGKVRARSACKVAIGPVRAYRSKRRNRGCS
eukprot:6214298-Pleurochrysis_carterae.AAC.2